MQLLTERYQIIRAIGRGGVGEVYEGRQVALDRPVAIKVLRPELTRNVTAVARFEQEARTTCRLHHPNVVTVFDVGIADDGHRFLVMELLEGTTLAERLRAEPPLTYEETLNIAQQIVRGMAAGQGVGLVHRDLKPENIFLVGDLHVKILDFGLATLRSPGDAKEDNAPSAPIEIEAILEGGTVMLASGDVQPDTDPSITFDLYGTKRTSSIDPLDTLQDPGTLSLRGDPMGTPRYMAPEQVLGWDVDHRSDLYSFGCILFEMLASSSPFPGPAASDFMRQHLHHSPAALEELAPQTPEEMLEIVQRLLRKSPADRFSDWVGLSDNLRRLDKTKIQHLDDQSHELAKQSRPTEPYRFLHPFTASFQNIFFGRDHDMQRFQAAWLHAESPSIAFLTGASGVGKSSFLAARVVPALEKMGLEVIRVRGSSHPIEQLHRTVVRQLARFGSHSKDTLLPQLIDSLSAQVGRPLAIVIDQLEELFTGGDEEDASLFQAGVAAILAGGTTRVRLLLSIREDFLGPLHRALHPLPLDEISRTIPLLPLEPNDLKAALEGPGRAGLAVDYAPFHFEDGLIDEIVADLLSDTAGEVAPRVQAVGARLWEMARGGPDGIITRHHYRERLGGAVGILSRILDEAITDLEPADRGLAKEILRAITHLPGSATSRPTPESELVIYATDKDRRMAVLKRLENRWRVVQGYTDPRWPGERTYRVAHEALINQIRHYGDEGVDRNRARQLFYQGFHLWLKGGMQTGDLLPEQHFEEVQRNVENLVLRTSEERQFFQECRQTHNEGWMRRLLEQRRALLIRRVQISLLPATLVALGFVLGQIPVDFISIRTFRIHALSALDMSRQNHNGEGLHNVDFTGLQLKHADFTNAELQDTIFSNANLTKAQFVRAQLERASFINTNLQAANFEGAHLNHSDFSQADLRQATVLCPTENADFSGARFDSSTIWKNDTPPLGALGPNGRAKGVVAVESLLVGMDLGGLFAPMSTLTGSNLSRTRLHGANLDGADLSGSDMTFAHFTSASLQDTDMGHAWLSNASFVRANLLGANLQQADLRGTDFHQALHLEQAQLQGAIANQDTRWPTAFDTVAAGVVLIVHNADLTNADLSGRNLAGIDSEDLRLQGASLMGTDLRGAVLMGADLRNADLREAQLQGAQLHDVDLCGADLRGANLTGATWSQARICEATRWPNGIVPDGLR